MTHRDAAPPQPDAPKPAWQPPDHWAAPAEPAAAEQAQAPEQWAAPSEWAPPSEWAAPGGAPAQPRRRIPTAVKGLLIGLLGLAVLIGGTWLAGGFEPRDPLTEMAPGDPLDLGPVTVVLQEARAYSSGQVELQATCQLTANSSDDGLRFAISDAVVSAALIGGVATDSESTLLNIGATTEQTDQDTIHDRDALSPQLQPIPCLFIFAFPSDDFGDKLAVVVAELVHIDLSNVRSASSDDPSWQLAIDRYVVVLPLTRAG